MSQSNPDREAIRLKVIGNSEPSTIVNGVMVHKIYPRCLFRIKDERSYSASNAIFMVNLEQIIHTVVANNQLDGLFYITYR